MKRQRTWWWFGTGIVLIALAATVIFTRGGARGELAETIQAPPAPLVTVGRLKATDIPTTLSLTANIISLREASMFSKVAGYLEAVTVRPGDLVLAGQVVAVVEHSQLDAQVAQAAHAAAASREGVRGAQAAVGAADAQVASAQAARRRADADLSSTRAALDGAKAQLGVAQAAYTRTDALSRDGLVAQQDLDNAKAQLQSAQAAVAAAQAQIADAQAGIEQADAQVHAAQAQTAAAVSQVQTQRAQTSSLDASLQNTELAQASSTIRAPWSGIVVGRSLDPGAYVAPTGGTPILAIADLDRIAVQVNVTEADMAVLRNGTPASIGVDAFPNRVFHGVMTRIAGGVDPDTRTVQVEIDVDNRDHALLPGMYARVRLTGAPHRAFVVPLAALTNVGDQPSVWVIENGKASRRQVTIGATTAGVVEITGGVSPDETIVVRGVERVRDGSPVRVAPANAPAKE